MDNQQKIIRYRWKSGEGKEPELKWIDVSQLRIDKEIQRQISNVTVLSIARDFDWAQFGTIDVNMREDGFYVFDGQHRFQAAVKRGIKAVPCNVHQLNDRRAEAMALVERNTNVRRMDCFHKHRLRVLAQEDVAVQIEAMVQSLGLRITSSAHTPDELSFISLLDAQYNRDPVLCKKALELQRIAIGGEQTLHDRIQKAIFFLLLNNVPGLEFHLRRLFPKGGKPHILNSINSFYALSGSNSLTPEVAGKGLLNAINHGLRKKVTFKK